MKNPFRFTPRTLSRVKVHFNHTLDASAAKLFAL